MEIPCVSCGVLDPVARKLGVVQQVDTQGSRNVDVHRAAILHRLDPLLHRAEHLPMWNWHLEVTAPSPNCHLVDPMVLGVPSYPWKVRVAHGGKLWHGFMSVGH